MGPQKAERNQREHRMWVRKVPRTPDDIERVGSGNGEM